MADPATPPFLRKSGLGTCVAASAATLSLPPPNECSSYTGAGATYLDFGQEGEKSLGTNLALAFVRCLDPKNWTRKTHECGSFAGTRVRDGGKIGLLFPSFPPAGFWSEVPGSCLALQTKGEGFVRGSGRSHTHKRGRACLAPKKKPAFTCV